MARLTFGLRGSRTATSARPPPYGAWRLIVESVNVLLEGTPRHIDRRAVEDAILETESVAGVHDLHIWTISSGMEALTAHIVHDTSKQHSELLGVIRKKLHDRFGIDHLTIQMETLNAEAEAVYVCEAGTKCFEPSQRHSRLRSATKAG